MLCVSKVPMTSARHVPRNVHVITKGGRDMAICKDCNWQKCAQTNYLVELDTLLSDHQVTRRSEY